MTNQQILEKAIQKAIDGGWQRPYGQSVSVQQPVTDYELWIVFYDGITSKALNYQAIIFNHDFAKSLFGTDMQNGQPRWRNALQVIVVQEDPIDALGRLIEDV